MRAGGFLDTNILLYSISPIPAEQVKRRQAEALLAEGGWTLSVQVLQEFFVQATRPSRPHRLNDAVARGLVRTWQRFSVQPMTLAVLNDALDIRDAHRLSYWDSAIVAAARASLCDEVWSEGMQHGQVIAGVRIVNPFR